MFDRRVAPDAVLDFVRKVQRVVPAHLAGGVALSGAHLQHRLSKDVDLFCHRAEEVRAVVRELPLLVGEAFQVVRDEGTFVRGTVTVAGEAIALDVAFDAVPDLEPAESIDGVTVESLADLRASKLTCLLSRAEPRDLVDVLFLERAGFRVEDDLEIARRKDAGMDPGVLAWLLRDFPIDPMPSMLKPLSRDELRAFRDALAERMRRVAIGE
jgi:hypothetical protein